MRRLGVAFGLAVALLLTGCGGSNSQTITADEYYAEMGKVGGRLSGLSEEDLDNIAKAFCGDLANMPDDDTRKAAALVVRRDVDSDANAIFAVRAMTKRWCPEYSPLYDS